MSPELVFLQAGLCLGRLGEHAVMLGQIAIEHGLSLFSGFGLGQSQFTDQPVLESSPQSLDSSLGLRGTGENEGDPEFIEGSTHFGQRTFID